MSTTRRPSARRALASALVGALVAAASIVGLSIPSTAADAPSISAPAAPRSGGTITVSGSGFSTASPGIYLGLRADGATTDDYTVWIDVANTVGELPGLGATAPMNTDGSFSVQVPVPAFAEGATYRLHTRKAHGVPDPSQVASIALSYEPAPALSTSTTLSASPEAPVVEGSPVTLTAAVLPGSAAGTIEFFDGSTSLGTEPLASGSATKTVATLAAGTHSLTATFTPSDSAAYVGSTSSALSYAVTAAEPEPEPEPVWEPRVAVFLADGTTPYADHALVTGDQLVVRGSGFDPDANVGGRGVPIPNTLPQGTYISFGSFLPDWRPSAGAPSSARKATDTKWILTEEVLDQIPTQYQSTVRAQWVELADDGTFTATLTATGFDSGLDDGAWGVYTYPAGGVTNAAQELSVPVDFVGDEPEPEPGTAAIAVTPDENLNPAVANTLTVTGSGFEGPGAANGAYVLFGESSLWNGDGAPPSDRWIAQAWVQPGQIVGGAFTTTLSIPAGRLDPAVTYQVATSAAHGLSQTDRSLDSFAAVTVAGDAPAVPQAFIGNEGGSVQQGGVLEITGTGFEPDQVVTATAFSSPVTIGAATASPLGVVTFAWTVPADFAAGAHTVELSVGGLSVASVPFTVTAAPAVLADEQPQEPTCVARAVSGASIQWGVKESFRNYVTGPIAQGSISGGWGAGSGAYSTDTDRGRVGYGGSVHYSGHGGLLDLTLSNPRIQVNGPSSAALILNVQSTGFNGAPDVSASGVVFATLSLPGGSQSGSRIGWSGASATLTAAGAEAFAGFYSAGTALDPVSFAFPLGGQVECDGSTSGSLAATGGQDGGDALWLGIGMLIVGAGVYALRRRVQRA